LKKSIAERGFLIRNPKRSAFKDVSKAKILFQNGSVSDNGRGRKKFAYVRVPRSCTFVILLSWWRGRALGSEGFENLG